MLAAGPERERYGAQFELGLATRGAVVGGHLGPDGAEPRCGGHRLMRPSNRASYRAVMEAADDRTLAGGADVLEDVVDVSLAVHDVDQAGSFGRGQVLEGGLGGRDAVQPLTALLGGDGPLPTVWGTAFFGRPAPATLVEQTERNARVVYGQGRMQVQAAGLFRIIEQAQP